jgi:hypothetical protein
LEQYAFKLEDEGYKLWAELKGISKEDLKDKMEMSPADVALCHAVLTNSEDRPDILRRFQIPEFSDIISFYCSRFPQAGLSTARKFALQLTDELGNADFSCHQITTYLANAKDAADALSNLEQGLPSLEKAEAARKRPEAPPPAEEPTCWIYTWLKSHSAEAHAPAFMGQALETRETLLEAPLDHKALEAMGIGKIGDRCLLLRLIEKERSHSGAEMSLKKVEQGASKEDAMEKKADDVVKEVKAEAETKEKKTGKRSAGKAKPSAEND